MSSVNEVIKYIAETMAAEDIEKALEDLVLSEETEGILREELARKRGR